jgi:hypothetical protein
MFFSTLDQRFSNAGLVLSQLRGGTTLRVVRHKNMGMSPEGPGTKDDCAFSYLIDRSGLGTNKIWARVLAGPETQNNCAGEGQ